MTNWLEKWSKVHDDSVIINEFLDFLNKKGISLCELSNAYDMYYPTRFFRTDLIYEHFGINADKLELQRIKLLESVQHSSLTVKQDG